VTQPEVQAPRAGVGGSPRAWRWLALRVALSVIVLGALFQLLPREAMWAALERVALSQWLLILACMAALHCATAAKWRMLVRAAGVPCGLAEAIRAHGAGLFAGLFLPGLIGTDVVRATLLARSGGAVAPVAVGSVADRLVDTAGLVFLAALIAGGLAARPSLRVLGGQRFPAKIRAAADKLARSHDALLARPSTTLYAFGLSVVLQAGFVLLSMWLGRAVGIEVPVAAWFLAFPLAKLTLLVPVTISGLGVREAALAALLAPFGVAPAVAVVQGLVWQTLQMGLALLGGLTAYVGGRDRVAQQLGHEAAKGINPS